MLVWFDHEEFWGGETYEDFASAATPAAPDFREFMEWYFLDKYKCIVKKECRKMIDFMI